MVDMARHSNAIPKQLADVIVEAFEIHSEIYKLTCDEYTFLDGRNFNDPFQTNHGTFSFQQIKSRIETTEQALLLILKVGDAAP
jgi:hypothetical protein